ncbi:hypothetical protein GYMLUDRAFT_315720 [Collybiopsis luxurians FD-317 M1]|nr:hypothetical protein GYMLUDRAFT_315720 [Collybiopsis luxurians FD-317 M1]
MSLALHVLKRQLCFCPHLQFSVTLIRRAQSTLIATTTQSSPRSEHSSTIPSKVSAPSTATPTSSTLPKASHNASSNPKRLKKGNNKPKKVPPRNLLEESKIQSYLAEIAESSQMLTLEDIDRLRPAYHSPPESPKYEEEYNALVDKLCRSFSRKQLRNFVEMLEIEQPGSRAAKQAFAVQIIEESWGWPSLAEIRAKKRDWSEIRSESFPLDPRQSFLILGKDGCNLHSLSRKYNIHISFSTKPLSLNAEGLRGALKQIRKHITSFKEEIEEEYYSLSSDKIIPVELLQRLSRLSGVFVEQFGEGQIRLSYVKSDPQAAFIAKRLVAHVLCDMEATSGGSILAYIPPDAPMLNPVSLSLFPHHYALYPLLSSHSLPWNVNASGAFRTRKVTEWIGTSSLEDVQKSGGLELGRGRIIDMGENLADVRQKLSHALPEPSESRSRVISAVVGHILLTPPSSGHSSLVPPLEGTWPISRLLKWVREEHRLLHRLTYEASPADNSFAATRVLELETVLPSEKMNQDSVSESSFTGALFENSSILSGLDSPLDPVCRIGHSSTVDLMLPDRPMDIHFSIFDSSILPGKLWPSSLQQYLKDLSLFFFDAPSNVSRPNAPITMHLDGMVYRLRSSVSVRQAESEICAPHVENTVTVITENVLDLEVDDKSTVCKIICAEPFTEDSWRGFLKRCDFLSGMRVATPKKPSFLDAEPDVTT